MSGAVEGVKIAACPFCGSTTGAEPIKDNRKLWSVRCGCGLHGTWNTRRYGAIDSWNDRAHRYRMAELKASRTTPPARSYADGVELACMLFEEAIGEGYPTPLNKRDQCDHGKFGWEDCIACYDDVLFAKAAAIRLLSQEPQP